MLDKLKDFIVVTGHYGCGKTNFSINLASAYVKLGRKVTVVDMDLVNPYFRTSDYRGLLEDRGIEVITPVYGATNLDIPSLPAQMYSIFEGKDLVILDVGGDDVGATVLGRFYPKLKDMDMSFLYLVNQSRNLTAEPEEAVEVLREIEIKSRLKATHIVNNTHLMKDTTLEILENGIAYAKKISELTGLPMLGTTVREDLLEELHSKLPGEELWPVSIEVKTSFY